MITVITTKRYKELLRQTKQCHLQIEEADKLATAANAEAERAREEARQAREQAEDANQQLTGRYADAIMELAELKRATQDPETGHRVRERFALDYVRMLVAETIKSGDPEAISAIRVVDLIVNDGPDAADADLAEDVAAR